MLPLPYTISTPFQKTELKSLRTVAVRIKDENIYVLLTTCGSHLQISKSVDWGHMKAKYFFLQSWETP